jgi:hypothetical protein
VQAILQQTCAPSTAADACERCVESNCCETDAACAGDPVCVEYVSCLGACLTDGQSPYHCADSCEKEVPGGLAMYAPHYACAENRCLAPGVCSNKPPGACEQCLNERCGVAIATCSADASCFVLRACTFGCVDDSCVDACYLTHGDASSASLLQDQLTCEVDRCYRDGPCG